MNGRDARELEGRAWFACPRRGCYLVVRRLTEIRIIEGLTVRDREFVCADCLEELDGIAAADVGVVIERTGNARP